MNKALNIKPALNPSIPSTKFIALVRPITDNKVNNTPNIPNSIGVKYSALTSLLDDKISISFSNERFNLFKDLIEKFS